MSHGFLLKGLGASPGRATGPLAFTAAAAIAFAKKGTPAIFVCNEAGAEDGDGVRACAGLVTTRGGVTGDGAIMARALGKPCLTSCGAARVRHHEKLLEADGVKLHEGDLVTLDAARGELTAG
jgi:pyruvate, orthophosphate dikinase